MEVVIRRFNESDKEKTLQFLKSVFGGWRTTDQWDWKFSEIEEVLDRRASNWVVEDSGKIIGHLAFIPMGLVVGNRVFPVCQLVDGALDPKYRHRGVYANLVQQVLLDAEKSGSLAAFGFANRPSYRIYSRLGCFQSLFHVTKTFKILSLRNAIHSMDIHLNTGETQENNNAPSIKDPLLVFGRQVLPILVELLQNVLASMAVCIVGFKGKVRDGLTIRTIKSVASEERIEDLWKKLAENYRIAIERDQKYLKWRYDNPATDYGILIAEENNQTTGYVITACEEKDIDINKIRISGLRIGHIVDLVAEKESIIPLLSRAEEFLKSKGVCLVTCWTIKNSDLHYLLQEMRYYQIPKEIGKITIVADIHSSLLKRALSSMQANDMLLMIGDSDLV
jgi:predicted N-acetyltransferase YhbS